MEDDEEALKEDEGRPRGTLGTEVCPRTPSKSACSAHYFALTGGVFGAARPLCDYLGQPPRGVASGPLLRPSPANRDSHMADRAAPKTPPATAKHWTASGGFRGGPWANLGS